MQSLLTRLGTGLLVTELMGQGVNGVTGDYSRGASGFWVENGAIAYPGAGDHDRRQPEADVSRHRRRWAVMSMCAAAIRTGSVLIGEMTIAGE